MKTDSILPISNFSFNSQLISNWLSDNVKQLEVIAQNRDIDASMIDRALQIVRKFIIDRELIIFGGLAIDYALRLKGNSIYPDNERPDFDFLSPHSVDDAYDLADILKSLGFEHVSAIRAIHAQTMSVKTDFVKVADISYTPSEVFNKIPILIYNGIKIVHPIYQLMDIHLSFCFPFSGAPREAIFHRWRKDLKRYNLLLECYPILDYVETLETKLSNNDKIEMESLMIMKTITCETPIPFIYDSLEEAKLSKIAIHGFAAYSIFKHLLNTGSFTIHSNNKISFDAPSNSNAIFVTSDPERMIPSGESANYYDPYMDIYLMSIKTKTFTVLSSEYKLLAASIVKIGNKYLRVVSIQFLLLYFLFESHVSSKVDKIIYLKFYNMLLDLLRTVDISSSDNPFGLIIDTIGSNNYDVAYLIRIAGFSDKLNDDLPKSLQLGNIKDLLVGLPQNYYPDNTRIRPVFDYNLNSLFRRAGKKR